MKMPRIPTGLLERCLETIPVTTVTQQRVSRLNLEERSRKRLVWLSAVAAIPVVTVIAILPVLKWNNLHRGQAEKELPVFPNTIDKLNYVRVESWGSQYLHPSLEPDIRPAVPNQRRLHIVDRQRGSCYLVFHKFDKLGDAGMDSQLILSDSRQYVFKNNALVAGQWGKASKWIWTYRKWISIARPESTYLSDWVGRVEPAPVHFLGTWKGKPSLIEVVFFNYTGKDASLNFDANRSRIRWERYSSVETGLAIAQRYSLDVQPGKVTDIESARHEMEDKQDVCFYQAEYFYQPRPDDGKYFTSQGFLKAARQTTP